jgi:hypothetical protein
VLSAERKEPSGGNQPAVAAKAAKPTKAPTRARK